MLAAQRSSDACARGEHAWGASARHARPRPRASPQACCAHAGHAREQAMGLKALASEAATRRAFLSLLAVATVSGGTSLHHRLHHTEHGQDSGCALVYTDGAARNKKMHLRTAQRTPMCIRQTPRRFSSPADFIESVAAPLASQASRTRPFFAHRVSLLLHSPSTLQLGPPWPTTRLLTTLSAWGSPSARRCPPAPISTRRAAPLTPPSPDHPASGATGVTLRTPPAHSARPVDRGAPRPGFRDPPRVRGRRGVRAPRECPRAEPVRRPAAGACLCCAVPSCRVVRVLPSSSFSCVPRWSVEWS